MPPIVAILRTVWNYIIKWRENTICSYHILQLKKSSFCSRAQLEAMDIKNVIKQGDLFSQVIHKNFTTFQVKAERNVTLPVQSKVSLPQRLNGWE